MPRLPFGAANHGRQIEREKARQRTYDAILRKARNRHVTSGRIFGYDNVDVTGPDGKRSHVVRIVNKPRARSSGGSPNSRIGYSVTTACHVKVASPNGIEDFYTLAGSVRRSA